MKQSKKSVLINTIKQIQNGNYLINGAVWFQGSDMRNALLGLGLPPTILPAVLIGSTINYIEISVTADDIAKGQNKFELPYEGRTQADGTRQQFIEFKKVGLKSSQPELVPSLAFTMEMMKMSVQFAQEQRQARTGATRPQNQARPANVDDDGEVTDDVEEVTNEHEDEAEQEHGTLVLSNESGTGAEGGADDDTPAM